MGSVRRGLTLALLPSAAWAEVCETQRPRWDGLPVTLMDEAIAMFSTVPSLILIVGTMLVIRRRSVWGGLAVVLGWSTLLTALISYDPSGLREIARAEGCIGDPVLFIGAVIVICGVILFFTAPRNPRPSDGDS